MEIRQLRYFQEVAKAGSILTAASELNMSQPSLSRKLSGFEAELGVVLFSRSTRGVRLTELGQRLLNHSEHILASLAAAERDICEAKLEPNGVVTLGATPSVNAVLLRPLIEQFYGCFPKMTIHVVESFSSHVCDWIAKGEADVGVIFDGHASKELTTEKILQEELFLVCPAGSPIQDDALSFEDLAGLKMILPRCGHGIRSAVQKLEEERGVRLSVACEVDSGTAALRLVADGYGCAIIPRALIDAVQQDGKVRRVRVRGTPFLRDIYIAWSARAPLSLGARELARLLRQQAHQLVKSGAWPSCTIAS